MAHQPQTSPVTSTREIQESLSFFVRWSRRSFYEEMERRSGCRLDRSAITILSFFEDDVEMWQSELAERIGIDRSTVSRQVAELVKRGLVEMRPDPRDKRATVLSLTREGAETRKKIGDAWLSVVSELIDDWSERDKATCSRLLARLTEGLQDPYALVEPGQKPAK